MQSDKTASSLLYRQSHFSHRCRQIDNEQITRLIATFGYTRFVYTVLIQNAKVIEKNQNRVVFSYFFY